VEACVRMTYYVCVCICVCAYVFFCVFFYFYFFHQSLGCHLVSFVHILAFSKSLLLPPPPPLRPISVSLAPSLNWIILSISLSSSSTPTFCCE